MKLEKIKDIIFDLGGVIIGLDTTLTVSAMAELIGSSYEQALEIFETDKRFQEYETGHLSDADFRSFFSEIASQPLKDTEVDKVWNAMILDIPAVHYQLLRQLAEDYRVHLLSNTNNIHLQFVNSKLKTAGQGTFSNFFEHEFYSHKMGLRKPNPAIYECVLREGNMKPESSLFLDDNLDNLDGANSVGINVYHVKRLTDTVGFFNER